MAETADLLDGIGGLPLAMTDSEIFAVFGEPGSAEEEEGDDQEPSKEQLIYELAQAVLVRRAQSDGWIAAHPRSSDVPWLQHWNTNPYKAATEEAEGRLEEMVDDGFFVFAHTGGHVLIVAYGEDGVWVDVQPIIHVGSKEVSGD